MNYHSGPGTYINSGPTLAHIETMVSFGHKKISMTNKKNFLGLRMQEKHLERLVFEPTTVLDYSKPLSNLRMPIWRTGHDRPGKRPMPLRPHWKGQYFAIGILLPDASAKALEDLDH